MIKPNYTTELTELGGRLTKLSTDSQSTAEVALRGAVDHSGLLMIDGKMNPLPFEDMLDPKTGRMQNRKVNVDGEAYECACAYMIRLEREDFEDAKQLAKLGAVINMMPDQFKARFGYLAGLK